MVRLKRGRAVVVEEGRDEVGLAIHDSTENKEEVYPELSS